MIVLYHGFRLLSIIIANLYLPNLKAVSVISEVEKLLVYKL
jgi:hypothetical protein